MELSPINTEMPMPVTTAATITQSSLADLFHSMSSIMQQMSYKISQLEAKLEAQAPTSIEDTLMEFLENDAFGDRVNEIIENHMRYEFDIDNHVDIADVVRDTINTSLTISFDI